MREKTQPFRNMTESRHLRPQEVFDRERDSHAKPECRLSKDALALVIALDDEPIFGYMGVGSVAVAHFSSLEISSPYRDSNPDPTTQPCHALAFGTIHF